jgi:glycosyltransferase involved in cell wall biosynthesis
VPEAHPQLTLPTIAYITNQFPSAVEWYVVEEIRELRRRGVRVIPCSSRKVDEATLPADLRELALETLYLEPPKWRSLLRALLVCLPQFRSIAEWTIAGLFESSEPTMRRARTLLYTWLGVYYGLLLRDRGVEHIHVHHGYFSAWVAMVAARMLEIPFSMTLHGSDLLMHAAHMNTKLRECEFCITVSEFNREHIYAHYPAVDRHKVLVQRLGVEIPANFSKKSGHAPGANRVPVLLAVGRLHAVKNHVFLLQACFLLRECGVRFRCLIVGDGPERAKLEFLIRELKIADVVTMVGHVPHDDIAEYYDAADLVVLTSHSEGIPLVLMEAMAHGKIVLAPSITGIPELVAAGKTGFLYAAGDLEQFVWQVEQICKSLSALGSIGRTAREHIRQNFDQHKNLAKFADVFMQKIAHGDRSHADENFVLQQI